MSHQRDPVPIPSPEDRERIRSFTYAIITLAKPRRSSGILPSVHLRYVLSSATSRAPNLIQGLTPKMVKHYAPSVLSILSHTGTLIFPTAVYGNGGRDIWPYSDNMRDGRPFTLILEWIKSAWASGSAIVNVKVPLQADDLVAFLTACTVLRMDDCVHQLEKYILDIIMCRALFTKEIKAIWSYASSLPLVYQHAKSGKDVSVWLAFKNLYIVDYFAQNLRSTTPKFWNAPFDRCAMLQKEFDAWAKNEPELLKFVHEPDLETYIEIVEAVPDTTWKEKFRGRWLEEQRAIFGRGDMGPPEMPSLESLEGGVKGEPFSQTRFGSIGGRLGVDGAREH